MADLDSKDFNILSTLKLTDRITLTDSETDHQFASMDVAIFLEQLLTHLAVATTNSNGLMSKNDKNILASLKRTVNFSGVGKYVLLIKLNIHHFNQVSALAVASSPGQGVGGIISILTKNYGVATVVALDGTSYNAGYFCRQVDGSTEVWVKINSDIQIDIIPVGGNGYTIPLTLSDTEPTDLIPIEVTQR